MRRRRANAGDVRGARQDFGGDHLPCRAVFTQTLVSSQRPPTFLHCDDIDCVVTCHRGAPDDRYIRLHDTLLRQNSMNSVDYDRAHMFFRRLGCLCGQM
jgi:hypothetical protein